jgi:ABC-type nickel/cobalt efflux system permease component RcnA
MGISFLLAVMIGVFLIWKKARRRIRRMPLYLRKR